MSLFSKSTTAEKLEKEIMGLRQREASLEAKRRAANTDLEKAQAARRETLASDDEGALAGANVTVERAQARARDLADALALITEQRQGAEQRLAAERDQLARQEEAKRVDGLILEANEAIAQTKQALDLLIPALQPLGADGQIARQMAAAVAPQLLEAALSATRSAHNYRDEIISGRRVVPTPPGAQSAAPPAPVIETLTLYTLRALRWRHGNETRTAGQWAEAQLPIALAEIAIAHNLADRHGTARTAHFRALHGCGYGPAPPGAEIVDLDQLVVAPKTEAA